MMFPAADFKQLYLHASPVSRYSRAPIDWLPSNKYVFRPEQGPSTLPQPGTQIRLQYAGALQNNLEPTARFRQGRSNIAGLRSADSEGLLFYPLPAMAGLPFGREN